MRFFIADTHFNHENIIKYCNRLFQNAKEMNEYIIRKWNSVVTINDIVYHVGDVGFGTTEELKNIISRLNGTKILIRGNHDFRRGVNGWKEVGFAEAYRNRLVLDNFILTHKPIEVEEKYINVFGDIHDKLLDVKFNKENHICMSCDVTGLYTNNFIKELKLVDKLKESKFLLYETEDGKILKADVSIAKNYLKLN